MVTLDALPTPTPTSTKWEWKSYSCGCNIPGMSEALLDEKLY